MGIWPYGYSNGGTHSLFADCPSAARARVRARLQSVGGKPSYKLHLFVDHLGPPGGSDHSA